MYICAAACLFSMVGAVQGMDKIIGGDSNDPMANLKNLENVIEPGESLTQGVKDANAKIGGRTGVIVTDLTTELLTMGRGYIDLRTATTGTLYKIAPHAYTIDSGLDDIQCKIGGTSATILCSIDKEVLPKLKTLWQLLGGAKGVEPQTVIDYIDSISILIQNHKSTK